MTYEQLKYFIAIYDSGSLNQAAKSVFISPQGISSGIRKLEDELGAQLFLRTPSGLMPTSLSRRMYPLARETVNNMEQLKSMAAGYDSGQGLIRFGFLGHNATSDSIREATVELCAHNSAFKADVRVVPAPQYGELFDMLDRDEVDIAWVFSTDRSPKYEYYPFSRGALKCALSPKNPLAELPRLTWTDLRELELIFPEKGGLYIELISRHCQRYGFTPKSKYYSLDSGYIAELIERDAAAGLFFWDYIDRLRLLKSGIVFKDIAPRLELATTLVVRADNSSALVRNAASYIQKALENEPRD